MPHSALVDTGQLIPYPQYLWLAGAILLGLVILWAISKRGGRTLTVSSSDESLRVKISRAGLQDLLRMACASLTGIDNPKPRIVIDNENRISPHVEFSLADNANLKEVQQGLKARIQETLEKHLGQDQIGEIEFTVTGFRAQTEASPEGILGTESPIIPPSASVRDNSKD